MNFLYARLKYSSNNIPNALNALGHTVTVLNEHPFSTMDLKNTVSVSYAEKAFRENHYDYAISDDFLVSLSDLCQKYHIPYIAWIYDSPMAPLFHDSVFNPVNRIFIFDSALCNRLRQIGSLISTTCLLQRTQIMRIPFSWEHQKNLVMKSPLSALCTKTMPIMKFETDCRRKLWFP